MTKLAELKEDLKNVDEALSLWAARLRAARTEVRRRFIKERKGRLETYRADLMTRIEVAALVAERPPEPEMIDPYHPELGLKERS